MRRYLLALLGFFFALSAFAGTYNAPAFYYVSMASARGATPEAACAAHAAYYSFGVYRIQAGGTYGICADGVSTYNNQNYVQYPTYYCSNGGTMTVVNGVSICTKTCAAGETLQPDGTCVTPCGTGQTRVNGVCTCDTGAQVGNDGTCCPVSGSGGGAPMQWCYVDSKNATSCDTANSNACKIRCNSVTFQGATKPLQIYPTIALGQSCSYTGTKSLTSPGGGALNNDELKAVDQATKEPEKAKTPEGCLAAGMGYVSGSGGTTCVSGGDTGVKSAETGTKTTTQGGATTNETTTKETTQGENGTVTDKETTTKTNPDGSTTTTTTTTSKNPDGTVTKETSTTTKDAGGNTTGTSGEKTNQKAGSFCEENPTSAVCKGFEDTCKDHPDRLGCMSSGDIPEQPDLATKQEGLSSIIAVNVASNASCPADLPLPKGMTFSFEPFCNYASAFRPIILVLAWITAGFLVFGYRGNNA